MPDANAPAAKGVAACVTPPMGRRFLPPLTAVPVVMGEEPWRERPRLGAMTPPRACSGVVHATVPGVHHGVVRRTRRHRALLGRKYGVDRAQERRQDRRLLRGQNAGTYGGRHALSKPATCPARPDVGARANPAGVLYWRRKHHAPPIEASGSVNCEDSRRDQDAGGRRLGRSSAAWFASTVQACIEAWTRHDCGQTWR